MSSGTTGNRHVALNIQTFLVRFYRMSQIMCEKMEPSPFHTGLGLRSQRAASTFSRSENLVAPSASAIRMSFPLQIIVPFNAAEEGRRDGQQAELASV